MVTASKKKKKEVKKEVRKSKAYMYYNDTYGFCTFLYVGDPSNFVSTCSKNPVLLSKESAQSFYEKIAGSNSAGYTLALSDTENGSPSCWLIYVKDKEDPISMLTTLSHECSHVAFFALEARNWSNFNTLDTQHAQMYLGDTIFENFMHKLNKDNIIKISM